MWLFRCQARAGFVLVESLLALLVFATVVLAMEQSWALVVRRASDTRRQSLASRLTDAQRERVLSGICVAGTGAEYAGGVSTVWTASLTGSFQEMNQTATYLWRGAVRTDSYMVRLRCD